MAYHTTLAPRFFCLGEVLVEHLGPREERILPGKHTADGRSASTRKGAR